MTSGTVPAPVPVRPRHESGRSRRRRRPGKAASASGRRRGRPSPIEEAAAKAAGAVQGQRGQLSIDLASASGIRSYGPQKLLRRLELLAPDAVFANESELAALGADPPAETLVVKRGAEGFRVGDSDYPAAPTEVVDTTGAGDALAAGFLVGGPQLAAEAAARCVASLGAMP